MLLNVSSNLGGMSVVGIANVVMYTDRDIRVMTIPWLGSKN